MSLDPLGTYDRALSFLRPGRGPPWSDPSPVRAELLSAERLEQHAIALAAAQGITSKPLRVPPLRRRLDENAKALLAAYRAGAREIAEGREEVPAAEWLLDNYHLIEAQIREIRTDLPDGYYRLLPKLESGPFTGYPRVFGIAWAFIAHTDSHFDPEILCRFLVAYQTVQPLTIGELWAVAITLRIVLVENLRRLTDQITQGRALRLDADRFADLLSVSGQAHTALMQDIESRAAGPLSEQFAAQLAKRLRDRDPRTNPVLGWLEERLATQGASIDSIVRQAQERLGASNVTLRNIITAMRQISATDWADLFESVSLVEAGLRAHPGYGAMDFPSRNLYRSAVEDLARACALTETEVVMRALEQARTCATGACADPGWYLIAAGRFAFERRIGYRAPLRQTFRRWGIGAGLRGYLGAIALVTALFAMVSAWALSASGEAMFLPWILAMLLPLGAVAVALVDRVVLGVTGAAILPGLDLRDGVPSHLRTVVAVPLLLTGADDLREQIAALEVHHLSGAGGDLTFLLLTDGMDAPGAAMPGDDALLAIAAEEIAALNRRYLPGPAGPRFLHFHRPRHYNPAEGVWMGWERKRGKLHALNRLLRGADDTGFVMSNGEALTVPRDVRYVITLDADTRMPRDTAARLIGKIAHPLNCPVVDAGLGQVTSGYGILQPRVMPALEAAHPATLFQKATSGPGGMDPYAAAVSDVWQDLFGEGSFTGKGIYDVDAFEAAMRGRIPDNSLLSHDLLEGVFARAGLASDVELVEAFPNRHDVAVRRQHRWTRGDWQLLRWLFASGTPVLGRVKIADTLLRSLVAPATFLAIALGWLLPGHQAWVATGLVVLAMVFPLLLPVALGVIPARAGLDMASQLRQWMGDMGMGLVRGGLAVAFLADTAWRMGDAIVRTLWRLLVTKRHLLEWTTAAQSAGGLRPGVWGAARGMAGGVALGTVAAVSAALIAPLSLPLILPFAALYAFAPAIAVLVSRPLRHARADPLLPDEVQDLRLTARATWRYFEAFATGAHSHLPPDNHQEIPSPLTAPRTSPTNMGVYLLSCVAARDFGWIGRRALVERLEATLTTMQALKKHRGHFYNWYATEDGKVLEPRYVSSVDSGNLAGHLIALANACEDWAKHPGPAVDRAGTIDALHLARVAIGADTPDMRALLDEIEGLIAAPATGDAGWPTAARLAVKAHAGVPLGDANEDLRFWLGALHDACQPEITPRTARDGAGDDLPARFAAIGAQARAMALAMDFVFLFDPDRKLLSIGWSETENAIDPGCYDLLASEARLASFFAIAKGNIPARHWFQLGREAAPMSGGAALISWSGSMFEYLMPALVMEEPAGSLLERTNRQVVVRQQSYARQRGVPWGISESAFNARDLSMNYQYSNFGVPGLGLKRGLATDLVVAPYATGLAAMFDPRAAHDNYEALATLGARGRFGFYEALDFTPTRIPDGETVAVVHSYMAHHQGMTIVAIANVLHDGRMRARFHDEPMIRAAELLLQERIPRDIPAVAPRPESRMAPDGASPASMQRMVHIEGPPQGPPVTHILSNGTYSLMLTARGAGYSRWGAIAVTRWQPDPTRETGGIQIWMRDLRHGRVHPLAGGVGADRSDVQFFEDRATFSRQDGTLSTKMDVLVSGEDNAEVRSISIASTSRRPHEVELTSCAELVLTTPAADAAHPAFAKMFVQTEYLPEFGALIATRRLRTPDEPAVWVAHFMVVEGQASAVMEYETDRAAFIGRDNDMTTASAITGGAALSGGLGTVLDPILALRQRVRIAPGGTARLAFWTVVAATRDELLDLVDRHHDRNACDRAKTLAWTQAQVQMRHLGTTAVQAAVFQRLTAPILYPDARFRAAPGKMMQGAGKQSALWPLGISGDLPIVVLRIDDRADIARVHDLLLVQEYWSMKQLAVDLVILNEHPASYVQGLQAGIEAALRSSRARATDPVAGVGRVFALRADLMAPAACALLIAAARLVIVARRGTLGEQVAKILSGGVGAATMSGPAAIHQEPVRAADIAVAAPVPELELFNGTGGFDRDGREYVTVLESGASTPMP
jgi:cyclic beta-1,2-glucan glucanotransferase